MSFEVIRASRCVCLCMLSILSTVVVVVVLIVDRGWVCAKQISLYLYVNVRAFL